MSSDQVPLICHFNGTLNCDPNGRITYTGGRSKIFRVETSITFQILKAKIYEKTNINPTEYDINILFKCPTTVQDYTFANIEDDEDTSSMLGMYPDIPSVQVVVSKEKIIPNPQGEFTRLLNVDEGTSALSPVQCTYRDEGISTMHPVEDTHRDEGTCTLYPVQDTQLDEGYAYPTHFSYPVEDTSTFSYSYPEGFRYPAHLSYGEEGMSTMPINHPINHPVAETTIPHPPSSSEQVEDTQEDSDEELNISMQENSLQCAINDDEDDNWVQHAYANNEDVEFDDPHPDEVIDDVQVQNYAVDSVSFQESRELSEEQGFAVGQVFPSKEKLVNAVTEWSLKRSVGFKTEKSKPTKYTIICANNTDQSTQKCPWRLVASVKKKLLHSNYFTITKYIPQHTCRNPGTALENRQVTSKWICQLILPIMRKRLDMTPAIIQDHIKLAWQRDISYYKAWDARRKTLIHLFGDWETSYHTLQQYMEAIVMRNPGTVYKITSENLVGGEHAMFTGFFWAFGPCIEGFRHCRPVLSIDGTHLYGKYPGCLLVATGVDADGGLYPLAFAIVDSETRDNWEWFFHCLRVYIPSVAHRHITFISDRMKGLPTALARGWQQPHHHRYCMRHIKANFKLKFKDESLQNLLYNAGRASELKDYESIRQSLKEKCPAADEWINLSLKPENEERWALCKDGGRRFCIMTTNCSESFNGVLKGARALPIQSLVARTFYRLNKYFVTRRETAAEKWNTKFTPATEKILKERTTDSRTCQVTRYSSDSWEVIDKYSRSYTVRIDSNGAECECNIPLLQKIPCKHVIRACSRQDGGANINFENFCSLWYTTNKYQRSYAIFFRPIPDSRYWPEREGPLLLPPHYKRKVGRPPSTRIKGAMDVHGREGEKKKNRCSRCHEYGHNKSRCTNPPI